MDYAIQSLVNELLQDSIQEHLMGFAKGLVIDINGDSASFREYGRGLPFESVLKPVGQTLKAACELSSDFYLCSYRDGHRIWGKYSKGILVEQGLEDTTEANGHLVRINPDKERFSDSSISMDYVAKKVKECAEAYPELSITVNGKSYAK